MFKLNPAPTFWAEVKVGGDSFKMEFKHLDRVAAADFFDRARNFDAPTDADSMKSLVEHETKALMEVCRGWDIEDAGFGKPAMKKLLNNYADASAAIMTAYMKGLRGERIKN